MTYRIEIAADTLTELAGKVMSLAVKLNGEVAADAPAAPKKEAATKAPVDPTPAPKSAAPAEAIESQPTTPEASSTPVASVSNVSADVLRDLVLRVVAAKGRETCEEVLSRFGLAKASDVAAEQAAELVAALEEQL